MTFNFTIPLVHDIAQYIGESKFDTYYKLIFREVEGMNKKKYSNAIQIQFNSICSSFLIDVLSGLSINIPMYIPSELTSIDVVNFRQVNMGQLNFGMTNGHSPDDIVLFNNAVQNIITQDLAGKVNNYKFVPHMFLDPAVEIDPATLKYTSHLRFSMWYGYTTDNKRLWHPRTLK